MWCYSNGERSGQPRWAGIVLFLCCFVSCGVWLGSGVVCWGAYVDAEDKPTPLGEFFQDYSKSDAAEHPMGQEEQFLLQHISPNASFTWQNQPKVPGVQDAVYEQLIKNSTIEEGFVGGNANPDGWMLAVHYPQGLGKADAAIQAWASGEMKAFLGVEAEQWGALSPEQGKAALRNSTVFYFDGNSPLESIASKLQVLQQENKTAALAAYYAAVAENIGMTWHSSITVYRLFAPSPRYVSIVFSTRSSLGGMHSNEHSTVLTFDRETGRQLTLKDVVPNWKKDGPRIARRLQWLYTGESLETTEEGYNWEMEALMSMFSSPQEIGVQMERMVLIPEGIVFIFNPYEIASYSEGTIQLLLPRKELKKLGVNMSLWQKK